MENLAPIDGNIFPEFYEKMKFREGEGEILILIPGMEQYLWQMTDDGFSGSGGEFKLVLYLRKAGDSLEVYKTDEVMLSEWKE